MPFPYSVEYGIKSINSLKNKKFSVLLIKKQR